MKTLLVFFLKYFWYDIEDIKEIKKKMDRAVWNKSITLKKGYNQIKILKTNFGQIVMKFSLKI